MISGDFDFRSVALKGVNLRTTYSMNEAVAEFEVINEIAEDYMLRRCHMPVDSPAFKAFSKLVSGSREFLIMNEEIPSWYLSLWKALHA